MLACCLILWSQSHLAFVTLPFVPTSFFLYVIYTLLVFVTCCQTFFHSNRFFSYFISFFFLLMTPVEFHRFCFAFYLFILNSVILKQCNNNSNKFTFLVFISGGIYGILVIVFYVLWLFRRKSEKKNSSIISRTWNWQRNKQTKDAANISCRNEFLVFRVFVSIW